MLADKLVSRQLPIFYAIALAFIDILADMPRRLFLGLSPCVASQTINLRQFICQSDAAICDDILSKK